MIHHGPDSRAAGDYVRPVLHRVGAAAERQRRLASLLRGLLEDGPPDAPLDVAVWAPASDCGMRVAALLRGINIGSHKRIAMPALRSIVESLGHTDVETYLQSGNVVFTQRGRADAGPALAAAIADATGLDVEVVTRTGPELARVVEDNPYPIVDPTKVVVGFLAEALELGDLSLGDLAAYLPDELTLSGREVYVSVPNGQARSKLMEALTKRQLTTTLTVRNWRTVTALTELTSRR